MKSLKLLFLTTLFLLPASVFAAGTCQSLFAHERVNPLGLNRSELLDKVIAVHATKFFPEDGFIHPGNGPTTFRPELHFALGALVRSHADGFWERMPFAVLAPLRDIEPQTMNLMAYDTFILGSFKLTPQSVLVMPLQDSRTVPKNVKVHYYDRATVSLRQAIEEAITEMGGLKFETFDNMGRIHNPAYYGKLEVNNPAFFAPVLEHRKEIQYGTHGHSGPYTPMGVIDLYLLRDFLVNVADWSRPSPRDMLVLDLLKLNLEKMDQAIAKSSFPSSAKAEY